MPEKISLGLILCLNFLIVISWKPTADYCKIKCHKKPDEHTACKCEVIAPRKIIENDLKKFRQEMVDVHNKYRNKIASGGEKDKGYPEAANMMAVSYSLELEYIAKCHAGKFEEGHDKCRDTANPQLISGQNLAGNSLITTLQNEATGMTLGWYNELDNVKKDQRENFIKGFQMEYAEEGKRIGHFAQFIWWSHTLVGCARVNNEKNKKEAWKNTLVCNYAGTTVLADSANIVGYPIYKAGEQCSACPKGTTCNPTYPGLCGTIDKIPEDTAGSTENTAGRTEDTAGTTKGTVGTTVDTVLLRNSKGNHSSSRTVRIYQNKLLLVFMLLVLCRNLN